jgi:hypothetical protein
MAHVMTEQVLTLESPQDKYVASATMFWCFDDRLWKLRKNFIRALGFKHIDFVQVAGACNDLAGDDLGPREYLLRQIGISIEKHGSKCVMLVMHIDCAACDGSNAFEDIDAEWQHHIGILAKAAAVVKERFSHLQVDEYVADFKGLHRILPQ